MGVVDHQRSTHQHGLDLDVVDVEGGEGEDTRLARAFLMGTSESSLLAGQTLLHVKCFIHQETFPRFASPKVRRIKVSTRHMLFILRVFDMITDWDLDGETWSHRADCIVYCQAHSRE